MATVLIIDDNESARRFLRTLCEHRGHDVSVAGDGGEGLAMARRDHPDLVITDALLPTMNGYEVAQQIRSDRSMAGTRVLLTTGATVDRALRELAARCGVTTVIPKPSEPEHVLAAIDEALNAAPPGTIAAERFEWFGEEQLQVLAGDLARKIDELRDVNAELSRSEERFRSVLGLAPAAIIGVDRAGRITMVNALAEAIFASPAAALVGQPVDLLVPEPFDADHAGHRETYMASPSMRPMGGGRDLEARRLDGTRFPVTVSLSTVGEGDDLTVLAAVLDMTDRVIADKEKARLEAMLAQTQRLESVGQLASGVAHDFNNLLAIIVNYANFVREAVADNPTVAADVAQIEAAAQRGSDLVRQLMLFSRSEPSAPQALRLHEVIGELRDLFQRSIGEHITLVISLDPELAPVRFDRSKLEQVIANLVVNARDAMPSGGAITIDAQSVVVAPGDDIAAPPGDYLHLSVTDTGTGMTREVLERAMDPFFTTKPRGKGTGLGLATVYGIVTQAGGAIRFESAPDAGTQAHVYLPALSAQATARERAPEAESAHGLQATVLVVEDQAAVLEIVRRILSRRGYRVVTANGAEEALRLAAQLEDPPALVLTDVFMPNISGPELIRQLRARWPEVRGVMMSGHMGDLRGELLAGFPLIEKPFTEQRLLDGIRAAFNTSS